MAGVLERVRQHTLSAFGYSPVLSQAIAASTGVLSPWADDSHLVDIDLAALFHIGDSVIINRGNALKIPTVAKIRDTIAGTIGRLPLFDIKAGQRNASPRAILTQPDPRITREAMLTWTIDQLLFYPNAWWIVPGIKGRDATGFPAMAELAQRDQLELDDRGNLIKYRGQPIDWRDVIRFDAPNEGLLARADRTLRRAVVIEMAAARAEDNPVPSFELHNTGENLPPEKIKELLDSWVTARRKYGVAYTNKSIETKDHGAAPEQLLIEGRKRVDLELVRHMGAQAWMADVPIEGSSITYANVQDRWRDAVNITLAPYMAAISGRLSMRDVTPNGWQVKFDVNELTQDTQQTRFQNYEIGLRAGFLTQEQIAAWEGWPAPAPASQPQPNGGQ